MQDGNKWSKKTNIVTPEGKVNKTNEPAPGTEEPKKDA
jgi:hypothetical protein